MAKRELTSSDRTQEKSQTLALGDKFPEQKQNKQIKKQSFPDYLKQVARRSRIGFGKVHQELLTTHKEKTMFDRNKSKRKSIRKTLTVGAKKWSQVSVARDSVSFKSYIEYTDEEDNNNIVSRNAVSESDSEKVAETKDTLIMEARLNQNESSKIEEVTNNPEINFKDNPGNATNAKIKELLPNSDTEREVTQPGEPSSGNTVKTGEPIRKPVYDVPPKLYKHTRESVYDVPPQPCLVRQRHVSVDTQLYDTPAATLEQKSSLQPATSDEHIYMQMTNSLSEHEESETYEIMKDVFEIKEKQCNDYVNLRSEISKHQLEKVTNATVCDSSTDKSNVDVEYAAVSKKMGKTNDCKTPIQEPEYDYVPCDELVNMLVAMHTNKTNLAPNREQLDSVYQNKQLRPDSPGNQQENSYVVMSKDTASEFYSYSVEQVVDVLKACAVPELAKLCKDEHLDGEYFRNITKEELCGEPFRMHWFHICKFYRIVNGWRPKLTTANKQ